MKQVVSPSVEKMLKKNGIKADQQQYLQKSKQVCQ